MGVQTVGGDLRITSTIQMVDFGARNGDSPFLMEQPSNSGDALEIRRLVDAYALAMDRNDVAAFADIFAPDGALVVCAPGRDEPMGTFEGPGIRGVGLIAQLMHDLYRATLHHVTTHESHVTGDTATGTTYCLAYHMLDDEDRGECLETLGVRYDEDFVRTNGFWRMRRRRATRLWSQTTLTPREPLLVDRAAGAVRARS